MEGTHEEATDRKHKTTDSVSTNNKYFAFLDEESSCSAENSSQSEEELYVKRDGGHVLECAKVWKQRLSITGVDGTVP